MDVDVVLSPEELNLHDLKGKIAVVIDVFRFTTTVLTALEMGIEAFFPVAEVEEAWNMKEGNPGILLAGEREALKIPGFDFGNSPLEHWGKEYKGGRLVCSTTNGTRAIRAAGEADQIILASLRTARAAVNYLAEQKRDIVFIPAGLQGRFSLEDTWCAGLLISYLSDISLKDGAKAALALYNEIPLAELAESTHGRRLQSLGLTEDLAFCLECDVSSRVAIWDPKTGWGSLVR